MGTKVLVVYGAEDRRIRRITIHDEDTEANRPGQHAGGEGLFVISKAFYRRHRSQAELAASLGLVG